MSFKTILITYIIGGLTFPPLAIIAAIYILIKILPLYIDPDDEELEQNDDLSPFTTNEYDQLKLTELEEKEATGVKAYRSGWITVTREYYTFVSDNNNDKQSENKQSETKSAYNTIFKFVKNSTKKKDSQSIFYTEPGSPSRSESSTQLTKSVRKKNRYFGVLRHGNLFLYKDKSQKDVQHVIVLSNNVVTIWPRTLRDGELFTKRSAICILKKNAAKGSEPTAFGSNTFGSSTSLAAAANDLTTYEVLQSGIIPPKFMGFFIYADTNFDKEDWYFDLIRATKKEHFELTNTDLDLIEPNIYANTLHFKTSDIMSLIQTLHSSEGQLQTRWLNAFIGRYFLSLQNTQYFEDIVRTKLLKKLAKINKPGFLDEFKIKKFDVGDGAPFVSFPKLVELNPDGSLKISMRFAYTGKLSLQVATKANINLGVHFKSREVNILLAVTLNRIEGPLIIAIKPPPTSRLWYTFEETPDIDLTIEPVVSQRLIKYGVITKVIENKLRDAIKTSLVDPYWDDISFFNTSDEFYRGGIWDTKQRPETDTRHADEEEAEEFLDDYEFDEHDLENASVHFSGRDNRSEAASLRSRNTFRSQSSYSGSISSSERKKTDSSLTSSEHFDGSSLSGDTLAPGSSLRSRKSRESLRSLDVSNRSRSPSAERGLGRDDNSLRRSTTNHSLSEDVAAGKKTISNSIKKIGKWYNEHNKSSTSLKKPSNEPYRAPEMIQSRKRGPSSPSDQRSLHSFDSNSDTSSKLHHPRPAPQAHHFPPEYLTRIDSNDNEGEEPRTRELQFSDSKPAYLHTNSSGTYSVPPSPTIQISPSSPPRVVFPKRKPVSTYGLENVAEHDDTQQDSTVDSDLSHAIDHVGDESGLEGTDVHTTIETNTEKHQDVTIGDDVHVDETVGEAVSSNTDVPDNASISTSVSHPPALPERTIQPPGYSESNGTSTPVLPPRDHSTTNSVLPHPPLPPRDDHQQHNGFGEPESSK